MIQLFSLLKCIQEIEVYTKRKNKNKMEHVSVLEECQLIIDRQPNNREGIKC